MTHAANSGGEVGQLEGEGTNPITWFPSFSACKLQTSLYLLSRKVLTQSSWTLDVFYLTTLSLRGREGLLKSAHRTEAQRSGLLLLGVLVFAPWPCWSICNFLQGAGAIQKRPLQACSLFNSQNLKQLSAPWTELGTWTKLTRLGKGWEEACKTLCTLLLGDDKWPGDPHPLYHSML